MPLRYANIRHTTPLHFRFAAGTLRYVTHAIMLLLPRFAFRLLPIISMAFLLSPLIFSSDIFFQRHFLFRFRFSFAVSPCFDCFRAITSSLFAVTPIFRFITRRTCCRYMAAAAVSSPLDACCHMMLSRFFFFFFLPLAPRPFFSLRCRRSRLSYHTQENTTVISRHIRRNDDLPPHVAAIIIDAAIVYMFTLLLLHTHAFADCRCRLPLLLFSPLISPLSLRRYAMMAPLFSPYFAACC